eukprot:scaffold90_cov264-Pinguiococcus_pyrenoidosus.AAC.1
MPCALILSSTESDRHISRENRLPPCFSPLPWRHPFYDRRPTAHVKAVLCLPRHALLHPCVFAAPISAVANEKRTTAPSSIAWFAIAMEFRRCLCHKSTPRASKIAAPTNTGVRIVTSSSLPTDPPALSHPPAAPEDPGSEGAMIPCQEAESRGNEHVYPEMYIRMLQPGKQVLEDPENSC